MTKLIVLDDDPTGTQTVQDVAVLTVWDEATLRAEFARPDPLFFILTNTRALPEPEARALNADICRNLRAVSAETGTDFTLISRGDSTLRGHFPAEPEALEAALGTPFDAWFLIPFFEEGGRLTRDDVHYVREGDRLVPAAETPFARDATFGYRESNLRRWVEEKTGGRVPAGDVASISLDELRRGDSQALLDRLNGFTNRRLVVVNAERLADLAPLARAVRAAAGKRFLFRTAASWVKALKQELDGRPEHPLVFPVEETTVGGLVVVGSYVPKTTAQLADLLRENTDIVPVELAVESLLDPAAGAGYLAEIGASVAQTLLQGRDVVLFTSRNLIKDPDPVRSLEIGNRVSEGLVSVVRSLRVRPRFLIAKGGITSSDVATQGLGVRRAVVRGQLLAGVPVWETGPESRFPGLWYVVFPGNVGDDAALRAAVEKFRY